MKAGKIFTLKGLFCAINTSIASGKKEKIA